jgi:hypothetical protein
VADDLPPGFRIISQPTAPQQGPPLLRPFKKGEKRPNADGSYSTEISMTGQDPTGKWENFPSLWMGPQGPQQFDSEDAAHGAADTYEKFGSKFPRFDTLDQANSVAEARSAAGGAATPLVAPVDDLPPGFRIVSAPEDVRDTSGVPGGVATAPALTAPSGDGVLKDVGLSALSGLPRGLIETIMTPATISRMVEDAGGYLYDTAESDMRSLLGYDQLTAAQKQERDAKARSLDPGAAISDTVYGAQDKVRGTMNDVLHKSTTLPGEVAGTIAEFATPGGIPSRAARAAPTVGRAAQRYTEDVVGNVIAPAVASEGAGKMAEGTPLEGPARFAGALAGNIGTAGARAYNAPEMLLRRRTTNMTPAEWDAAIGLQNNPTGVKLTGPEAIAQATGGASGLPNVQRLVEGSGSGQAVTGPFFAARPGQVTTAVGDALDTIGPQSADPYALGPRAAEAAGNVVQGVRQDINKQTRPLYDAAELDFVPDAKFAELKANPSFQASLDRIRSNPEFAKYGNMPENSVGVVDAVTKDMFARGEALANKANPLYGPELGAQNTAGAADARNAASSTSPNYAQALAEQEALRRTILDPVQSGPVGRVAAANDIEGATEAILPKTPQTGSAARHGDATARLIAEDPETTKGLVRQNLANRYNSAITETQGMDTSFAGAKFHKNVAGGPTQEEVLDAVMRAVGEQPAAAMEQLLPVLQATGRRKPIGSATAFNDMDIAELGNASVPGHIMDFAKSLGTSLVTKAGDATRRATLRGNLGTLAQLFTDPHTVELIRDAVNRGIRINLGEAAGRTAAEAGGTLYDPRGAR